MNAAAGATALVLLLFPASVAYAHDIWLLPERFALSKGDTLTVHQLAGTELESELELPLLWRMTPRFELITPKRSIDLLGELPDERTQAVVQPVLERGLDFEGPALLTMEHAFFHHTVPGPKFLEYLAHEEFKIEEFRGRIGRRAVERERYARTLKCLIQVGEVARGGLHKQVLGQKIEILLLQNPYLLDPGDDLEVQVLFDGEPLGDQLVTAHNSDGTRPVSEAKARTDARGIARFKLDRKGAWLVRLVHLLPCPDPADCDDADWQSYWASYSFELD